jgi:hypothetical protein
MEYYPIELNSNSKRLRTIVQYEHQKLPMALSNSPDIFQEKMSTLMTGLEYVHTYIDDLLVKTMSTWEDHLQYLELVFARLSQAGFTVNTKKSFFGRSELEYLGYWIIQPVSKKVEAIKNIAPPKIRKELHRFSVLLIIIETCGFEDPMYSHR